MDLQKQKILRRGGKSTQKVKVKSLSCVRLFVTRWTVAYQAPLSLGFSRQEHWSGLPFPSPKQESEIESEVAQLCLTLKEISNFSNWLFSSISLHWSLSKALLFLLAILWNSVFKWVYLSFPPLLFASLLSHLFVMPPQTASFLFCICFSWGWSWFLSPVQCHELPSTVHQALCLSDLVP